MRKFLASDLDGTLIHNSAFNRKDIQAIQRFREEGGFFSLCTGRTLNWTVPLFDWDALECDAMILGNGSAVYTIESISPLSFTEIVNSHISYHAGLEIINFFYELKDFALYWSDGQTTYELADRTFLEENSIVQNDYSRFVMIDELYRNPITFSSIGLAPAVPDVEKTKTMLPIVQEKWGDEIEVFRNQYFLDICPKNSSKGFGIRQLAEFLSEPFEFYAVGDSFNDVAMFEFVGKNNAFVMENAEESLKNQGYKKVKSVRECIEHILSR